MATQRYGSGTTEGTDQASAERNLRQEFENIQLDERFRKEYEAYERSQRDEKTRKGESILDFGFKMMGKDRAKSEPLPGKPSDKDKKPENLPGKGKTEKLGEGMKKYASGGKVSSASARADGCAQRGKTRGKIV